MPEPQRIPVGRRRRRPTRTGTVLSEELIVSAALELIEAPGGSALTVRRLGEALGCDPSAVYRYFANTDALLLAVADRLIGDSFEGYTPGEDWTAALRDFATRVHRSVLSHPRLATVRAARVTAGPAECRAVDTGIGILLRAGFPPAEAVRLYRTFIDTVLAHAALDAEVAGLTAPQRRQESRAWHDVYGALPPGGYPNLHTVRDHLAAMADSAFPDALDLLLAQFAARLGRGGPDGGRG
ncbi:TetR/AcrR family transcriptional regulator C-terminal domain-containing protein [Streptomyces sp. LP11]|uniref:TetR/AcrR family transcriptional regulator C-terminal domain-containing protein n=1 Tax=Streptomyces pyxinicus TaxID=2970331 RepID=A0ABT2B790_9ACTN|nr:TetR/AcrR family transcriptional regulator C-terminal domain-containing protein [Streptomyces sp. LP11]MCS0604379.1 TetR/AcrR family transcriptional regulator C-terminal domain-containing protein [Streptomyces sp. LP11]